MTLRHRCPSCGFALRVDDVALPLRCVCGCLIERLPETYDDGIVLRGPGLVNRGVRATTAFMRWTLAGFPVRTDQEVEQIFIEKCSPCLLFVDYTCTHKNCGCQIRDVAGERTSLIGRIISTTLSNKIRWATEHCPIGLW